MGFFLRHTRGKKWNVLGIEPSPALSNMARKHFGLKVKTAYLENAVLPEDFFDVVAMTDVFEHISKPKRMLADIKKILKKDGILFIKIPNGNYNLLKLWLAKLTRTTEHYDIFDSYEHLVHYTYKTLKKMLDDCGFVIRKTFIGKPIQLPVWHKYVGHYYQYPSPWILDAKNHILRLLFYRSSKIEFLLRGRDIGYLSPNIIMVVEQKIS